MCNTLWVRASQDPTGMRSIRSEKPRRSGKENFVSAVVHMDEKTPHLHLTFVPITEDGRLCAKEIIGNKKALTEWQDQFWSFMVKRYPELERGESASETGRDHIPPRIFKQAANLNRQAKHIMELLGDISPLNAKKRASELEDAFQRFFPDLGRFLTEVKKYDAAIRSLKADNAQLREEAKDAGKESYKKLMAEARLRADYENLQRVMERIPPEIVFAYAGRKPERSRGQETR